MTVLETIGRTTLIPIRHMTLERSATILLKLECENPTGSMKDRMALAMVEAAEKEGRLRPGGSVVEYTGGSTGVSLAMVCAAKRIPLQIVTSQASSQEKRDHMKALGARVTLVPSPTGGTTRALIQEMIETAKSLASAPGSYFTDQLNNTDPLPSYELMGEEIWEQTRGRIDAFVQCVGTAGSLRGISTRLRAHDKSVHIVAVEPAESAVLSGGPSGSHKIEGAGAGFVVPLWIATLADEIQTVSTEEAIATARLLARTEGIFAGTSTGANLAAALRVADRLGAGRIVVTLAVDSGMKYLSTELYTPAMKKKPAAKSIDDYLAPLSDEKRAALQKLRRQIKAAAPKAEECISYGIPAFRLRGRLLVAFGAAVKHCAFYPGALPVEVHERELAAYSTSKGTVRFQADAPLPGTLVRKLVKTRIAERAANR